MTLPRTRAMVTGAGSGIGRASALRLAAEGADVALVDINTDAIRLVQRAIETAGGRAMALTADVAVEEEIAESVTAVRESWGGLDVAITAAGIASDADGPAHQLDAAVWRRIIDVNLTGTFLTCKHAVGAMLPSHSGNLILVGSPTAFGVFHAPHQGVTAYSTSKGGIHSLMRQLACTYGPKGIRVNAVVPGFTDTPLVAEAIRDNDLRRSVLHGIPMGRPATADEIASLIFYLTSNDASYVCGALITVDGGISPL